MRGDAPLIEQIGAYAPNIFEEMTMSIVCRNTWIWPTLDIAGEFIEAGEAS